MARSVCVRLVSIDKHLRRRQSFDRAGTQKRIVISAAHAVVYLFINLMSLLEVFELVIESTGEVPAWHQLASGARCRAIETSRSKMVDDARDMYMSSRYAQRLRYSNKQILVPSCLTDGYSDKPIVLHTPRPTATSCQFQKDSTCN
jgi:hypothetical protein